MWAEPEMQVELSNLKAGRIAADQVTESLAYGFSTVAFEYLGAFSPFVLCHLP